MNLYLHELKLNKKSILIWSLSLAALIVLFLSLFPAFTKDVAATKKIIDGFPPAFKAALNISVDTFFSIFGFYIYIFSFVILAGSVLAMNLGVAMTSKEEHDKTADFLLTKPISRVQILTAKLFSALTIIVVVDLIFFAAAILAAEGFSANSFSIKTFLLITLIMPFVQLIFLALGMLLSVTLPKIKSIIAISLPIIFAFFAINMFGSVLGDTAVRYMTPFKFYDPVYVVAHGGYEPKFAIIEIIFIIVVITASYLIYNKKDIPAAS